MCPLVTMRHEVEVRVRYFDTDQMGVANHIHYFRWFEMGRAELLRDLGTGMKDIEETGARLVLAEVGCKYKEPSKYDDLLKVRTEIAELRPKVIRFQYTVWRDGTLLAEGFTVHVCTDGKGHSVEIPKIVLEKLMKSYSEKL